MQDKMKAVSPAAFILPFSSHYLQCVTVQRRSKLTVTNRKDVRMLVDKDHPIGGREDGACASQRSQLLLKARIIEYELSMEYLNCLSTNLLDQFLIDELTLIF